MDEQAAITDQAVPGRLVTFLIARTCMNLDATGTVEVRAQKSAPAYPAVTPQQKVIRLDRRDEAGRDVQTLVKAYLPDIVVIGNVEFDHADIYPDLDAVRLAFRRLVNLVPQRGLMAPRNACADGIEIRGNVDRVASARVRDGDRVTFRVPVRVVDSLRVDAENDLR